jgi:hypothetical protein
METETQPFWATDLTMLGTALLGTALLGTALLGTALLGTALLGHRPSPVRSVAGVCEAGRHDLFVMSIQSGLTEASYRCCGSEL